MTAGVAIFRLACLLVGAAIGVLALALCIAAGSYAQPQNTRETP